MSSGTGSTRRAAQGERGTQTTRGRAYDDAGEAAGEDAPLLPGGSSRREGASRWSRLFTPQRRRSSLQSVPTAASSSSSARATRRRNRILALLGAIVLCLLTAGIVVAIVLGVRSHHRGSDGDHRDRGPAPDPFKLPPPQPGLRNPSYLVRGRHGAVATESEICSQIGLDILKENGTATDAAIGSALCSKSARAAGCAHSPGKIRAGQSERERDEGI